MNDQKIIEKARANARDATENIRASLENAKEFLEDKNEDQAKVWKETLLIIKEEAEEAIAELIRIEAENAPSEFDDAKEDALAEAEGRTTAEMLDGF